MPANKLILILLGLLVAANISEKADSAPQSGDGENLVFGDENLTFSEDPDSASGENLTYSDAFGDSTEENIRFDPVEIPETDLSQAADETEPNDEPENASPLQRMADDTAGKAQFAAQSTLSGDDDDYFSFRVEGESQLFLIEAVGPGVDRLTLYESAGKLASGKNRADGDGQTITGIYLAPGDYQVAVEHFRDDGDFPYSVRAISMGAPDPYRERESNDSAADAELLVPGRPRTGLLLEPDDVDYYRFSLMAEQLLRVKVESPPEVSLRFVIDDEKDGIANRTAETAGEAIEYTALFLPGNYFIKLYTRKGTSNTPYVVSLSTGNRFHQQVDLEPNDHPHQARPLPADGVISGRSRDFGDYDWYSLPEIDTATTLTIHSEAGSQRLLLHRQLDTGKTEKPKLSWSKDENTYSADLQAGERYLLEVGVQGDYVFRVALDPAPGHVPVAGSGERLNAISLDVTKALPDFAAFWHQSQSTSIPLAVGNRGDEPANLTLDVATSDPGWQVTGREQSVVIDPGQTVSVPLRLEVAPDARCDTPVRIDFKVEDAHGSSQLASTSAAAACGLEPVSPGRIWSMPDELLGGFNVAWTGLGGTIVDAPNDSYGRSQPQLYDGVTPNDGGWARVGPTLPLDVTVKLAGTEAISVAGVILNPQGQGQPGSRVQNFELHLSRDGTDYDKVLSGTLSRAPIPQHFVLPQPIEARYARLRILSGFDPRKNRVSLGEFSVIADPTVNPFPGQRLNLADPKNGGYVAWSQPHFRMYLQAEGMLTEDVEQPWLGVDNLLPTEWVIGFQHSRAAQITELQWVDSPGDSKWPRFNSVQVSISTDGAAGPWEPLGTWNLDRSSGPPNAFVLQEPVWARFVRFVSTDTATKGRTQVADTLRILEREVGEDYRSILAEWGQYSSAAVYEWLHESPASPSGNTERIGANGSKGAALQMVAGTSYRDQVERGSRAAWYRFEMPGGHNRLRFSLTGYPVANVIAKLEDDTGTSLPLDEISRTGGKLLLESVVNGGKAYWLRIEEPKRHVAMVWDNSSSVRPYQASIYSAIRNFARDIQPANEYVQLLPFSPGGFLLEDWSNQTSALIAGLQSYPRRDDDSNAEEYLMKASVSLATKEGARAVVLVTDAETFSYDDTPALWESLSKTRPRVFAVGLHRGNKVAYPQDLMQSWASVNNGFYTPFRQSDDLDIAFDRAFCHLRRPVRYSLVADSRFEEPPGPGFLSVETGDAISANAVELILDASGSMLQRLDGTRRIEIARNVLTDLVNETIPDGTLLALRVFGHRKPDACDTDLAVPLQPLDRAKVTGVIKSTQAMNLARTPIGSSLVQVANDLEDVDGQKLIILITDGEETCDGDPAGAIADLKEAGHDVRINIVGFAIDDAALKAEFESWARMGGGLYFNARNATQLDEALKKAMRPKFQVLDDTGAIIATGSTGAGELQLPSGTYTVKILTSPVQTFDKVTIEPKKTRKISATANPGEADAKEKR